MKHYGYNRVFINHHILELYLYEPMIERLTFLQDQKIFIDYFNNNEPLVAIKPLSKINFFIGANNSGKSRLLRELIKELHRYPVFDPTDPYGIFSGNSEYIFTIKEYKTAEIIKTFSKDIEKLRALGEERISVDILLNLFKDGKTVNERHIQSMYIEFHSILNESKLQAGNRSVEEEDKKGAIKKCLEVILQKAVDLLPNPVKGSFLVNYVPILRSLRSFMAGNPDKVSYITAKREEFSKIEGPVMANRIFWDYFTKYSNENDPKSGKPALYDGQLPIDHFFTGETMFKKVQELRNDVEHQRQILQDFERFLSNRFFNGQTVELNALNIRGVENIYVKIGKEKEYPIYDLGDGIQAVILLTFPLFYYHNRRGHILFYEEPELYLHPGMQRIFIESILEFPNVQVFIATHSNHFLDTSVDYPNDISIFSMEKTMQKKWTA